MENGSLLIVCSTEKHSHCFLKSTVFCNVPIKVSPQKGAVKSKYLEDVGDDEILENLSPQDVTTIKRIEIRRDDIFIPTNTLILTFIKPTLPKSVKAGFTSIPDEPFVPNSLRCFKCQRCGHSQTTCHKLIYACCGQFDHDNKSFTNDISCIN